QPPSQLWIAIPSTDHEPVPSMPIKTAVRKPKISARVPAKKLRETKSRATKAPAKKSAAPEKAAKPAKPALGGVPDWDVTALTPGTGAPKIKRDLARADPDCNAFEERYKGKLSGLADGPDGGRALAAAIKELEEIDDLIGRIASFAQLVYTGNTA